MSCSRMEQKILAYVDGRLKESERLDVEKHLAGCGACKLRVQEFRAVNSLLAKLQKSNPNGIKIHGRDKDGEPTLRKFDNNARTEARN